MERILMTTKFKPNEYTGFLLTFETERTKWIANRIEFQEVIDSFSSIDNKFDSKELVVLILDQEPFSITGIALMERVRGSGGSGKAKMKFTNYLKFNRDVILLEEVGCQYADINSPDSLKRMEWKKWDYLVNSLIKICADQAEKIREIIALRTDSKMMDFSDAKGLNINEQRDALGLLLEIADIDRKPILSGIKINNYEEANSVLDIFDSTDPYERDLLEHDAKLFRKLLRNDPTNNKRFSDGHTNSIRVMVTDMKPIEEVLGIDLIMYNACYQSYILLQYKRMEKASNNWRYSFSPSSNIHDQLEKMEAFNAHQSKRANDDLWNYRLNSNPFYFKFCERKINVEDENSLIKGLTINEECMRAFIRKKSDGNNSGGSIGYENCSRYLNNSEFIQLAKSGWIGANNEATKMLTQILSHNQKHNRAAMLAIIDTPRSDSASGRGRRKK